MSLAARGAWPHWTTPPDFLDRVRQVGPILLDPCSNRSSQVGAETEWLGLRHMSDDGLAEPWGLGLVYVNPPYGRELPKWTAKMAGEGVAGAEIVALLPAYTGPKWMHENVFATARAALLWGPGRIRFGNPPPEGESSPTMDNFVAYWGRRPLAFFRAFEGCGQRLRLVGGEE